MNCITNDHSRFAAGLYSIRDLVASTMGLGGAHVTVCGGKKGPMSTNDGARVVSYYMPDDPLAAEAVRRVQSACESTVAKAGDGTSTTAILLAALYKEGMEVVANGVPRHHVVQGMRLAVGRLLEELKKMAIPAVVGEKGDVDLVTKVVSVAMHGDIESASKIATLVCDVGIHGTVLVENAKGSVLETERIDGMSWGGGVMDVSFFTDAKAARYEESYVLLSVGELDDVEKIARVMQTWQQACQRAGALKPLIIVCPDISGSARMLLTRRQDARSGVTLPICCVRVPRHPMWEEMMQDLAAVTGGKVFDAKKGSPLDDFEDERDFGQVARVVALRDRTTFLPAEDRKRLVVERSDALRAQAEVEKDEEMEATLRSRIAAISGGVGVIRVPVLTGGDYSDKRELYEDAYMAAFSAMSEGVLPGGGFALLRALYRIDGKVEGDIEPGFVSVGEALRAPVRVILSNGGVDPNKMVVEVIFKDDWRTVYDLRTKTIGDCVALGVLDSVRVVSTALENAAAEACLLVMTENFLYEEHDKHGNHSK